MPVGVGLRARRPIRCEHSFGAMWLCPGLEYKTAVFAFFDFRLKVGHTPFILFFIYSKSASELLTILAVAKAKCNDITFH